MTQRAGLAKIAPVKANGIDSRVTDVETRMDAVEQTTAQTHALIKEMIDAFGKPQAGPLASTGIYAFIDAVSVRLTWFEKLRERAIGAITVAVPLLGGAGVLLWALAGDKVMAIFK